MHPLQRISHPLIVKKYLKEPYIECIMKPIFYIATPYSHVNPHIRELRFAQVTEFCARQSNLGVVVFSPITHSHEIAKYGTPTVWSFWKNIDIEFIQRCAFLVVLKLDGWQDSVGVTAEITLAKEYGATIMYLDYNENIPTGFSHSECENYFFKTNEEA